MSKLNNIVKELVDGINAQPTRTQKIDADTLCSFGVLGLETPRNLVKTFYNAFKKNEKKSRT
jgi:hypothetical protein